jgi:hypothetical protein
MEGMNAVTEINSGYGEAQQPMIRATPTEARVPRTRLHQNRYLRELRGGNDAMLLFFLLAAGLLMADSRPPSHFAKTEGNPGGSSDHRGARRKPRSRPLLHGPGKDGIKKSHHEQPADDPFYVWSGECNGAWAATLRPRFGPVDLTGRARIRWRSKQSGFRALRIVLRTADNTWLVSDAADPASIDWREREFILADLRWRKLSIATVTEGDWTRDVDLSKVVEVGFTDLMAGGGTPASSRLDWIEVYGRLTSEKPASSN